jgi:hypothetical protein
MIFIELWFREILLQLVLAPEPDVPSNGEAPSRLGAHNSRAA